MWFIIMFAFVPGHQLDLRAVSDFSFPTYAACMADARARATALASADAHGRYLCMHHNERDAELRKRGYRSF